MLRRLGPLVLVAPLALAPAPAAAKKKSVKHAPKGATTLALSDGAAAALQSLGIAAAPLKPARAGEEGIAFPVTAGKLNAKTYAGQIKHSGGLSLTRGATRVELRNFTINVDGAPDLTARVGNARVPILDLGLSQAKVSASGRKLHDHGREGDAHAGGRRRPQRRVRDDRVREGAGARHRHGVGPG